MSLERGFRSSTQSIGQPFCCRQVLPLPSSILVHGYVTVDGKKIGKSAGNGVDPGLKHTYQQLLAAAGDIFADKAVAHAA